MIGTVDGDVADGAGPGGAGGVRGVDLCIGDCRRRQVALQADSVDIGQIQEFGIAATVRLVTSRATCLFDGWVLVHPWAREIRVAL